MQQKPGTTTDQLNNILQVLQLGRKTGHLIAERGEGTLIEKGEIIFVNGQMMSARCENINGEQALQWLQTWGQCRFIFVNTLPGQITPAGTGRFTTGPLDAQQFSPTYPPFQEVSPQAGISGPFSAHTGAHAATKPARTRLPDRLLSPEQGKQRIMQSNLSRQHLHLFLLADGHHAFEELVRLMGKPPENIQRLLLDLKYIGAILY